MRDGETVIPEPNGRSIRRRLQLFCAADKFGQLRQFKRTLLEQCDSEPLDVRGVDPGNEGFEVRITTTKLKVGKGREKNMCRRVWARARAFRAQIGTGLKEVNVKQLEVGFCVQASDKGLWWEVSRVWNRMKPKKGEISGGQKELR